LLEEGAIREDPHQLALIKRLTSLSSSLQEYKPNLDGFKIKKLVRDLEIRYNKDANDNGSFLGYTLKYFKERESKKIKTEIVKVLSDFEELESERMKDIPKGLLINGEVGCGKSMLVDIFADSLPIEGKWRVHWSVFIQWVFREIEVISKRKRERFIQSNHPMLNLENEFILYEVSSKLINRCHVLILDEFMLPDIASAKIVNILFLNYFKFGGVLISSSNRLPEELYSGSINKLSMGSFEKVLRLRCDVWNMISETDYRKELKEGDVAEEKWLFVGNDDNDTRWNDVVSSFIDLDAITGNSINLQSYGRNIRIPKCNDTVAYFKFDDIVQNSVYGPSDFISISNKFPVIIIDKVPVLSSKMKNQARLLINFIDSIYDSKCKLLIRMEDCPEKLFFPEKKDTSPERFKCTPLEDGPNPVCMVNSGSVQTSSNNEENQDIEMFASTQMDLNNPFRPNFATYEDANKDYQIKQDTQNFTDLKKFTGEDELFAYKRAVSRINEMTLSMRWRKQEWLPLHQSLKMWETSASNSSEQPERVLNSPVTAPGTFSQDPNAPSFKDYNFWSMGEWKNKESRLKDGIARKWVRGAKH